MSRPLTGLSPEALEVFGPLFKSLGLTQSEAAPPANDDTEVTNDCETLGGAHVWFVEDPSFDHAFGTHRVEPHLACEFCPATKVMDGGDL